MSKFALGDEVLFKGERTTVVGVHADGLIYDVEKQPGSMLIKNIPSVLLSRPSVPPSPADDPVARIEQSLADINQQLKGIRELLSKRMPKQKARR